VIKHTGMFDNVDIDYMVILIWPLKVVLPVKMAVKIGALGGGGGASFGGGGIGGEDLDFSDEEPTEGEEASLEGGEIAEGGEATR
jgi:hypothetical protein